MLMTFAPAHAYGYTYPIRRVHDGQIEELIGELCHCIHAVSEICALVNHNPKALIVCSNGLPSMFLTNRSISLANSRTSCCAVGALRNR